MNNTKEVIDILQNTDLYKLLRRKEQYSEFIDWTYKEHFKTLFDEIRELKEWIMKKDTKNIQEEFSDVIYMIWQLANKLNKDWYLKWLDFKNHSNKIYERSPQLKTWEKVSREKENIIWQINKILQNNKK